MRALILGGADCVWDDVALFEQILGGPWTDVVIAVNDIGIHWPRELHHWVSLHPNKFKKWKPMREQQPTTWTRKPPITWGKLPVDPKDAADNTVAELWMGGSSGLFAVQIAKMLGCSRAVLCGIPMTSTGHFAESTEEFPASWGSAENHIKAWHRHRHQLEGWVRSMSGRTRNLLGEPTLEWLYAD